MASWSRRTPHGGVGTYGSGGGVYLLSGSAVDRGQLVRWAVVLKVAPPRGKSARHHEPSSPTYWRRDLLVYESGLFDCLPDGLVAPRFFGGGTLQGKTVWLWLEHVEEGQGPHWPLERYGLAARHLGRLGGLYLVGRPLPDLPWLARQGHRQELTSEDRALAVEDLRRRLGGQELHPDLTQSLWQAGMAVLERRSVGTCSRDAMQAGTNRPC